MIKSNKIEKFIFCVISPLTIPNFPEHVCLTDYRVYLLQSPSKGPHNLTSIGPHALLYVLNPALSVTQVIRHLNI